MKTKNDQTGPDGKPSPLATPQPTTRRYDQSWQPFKKMASNKLGTLLSSQTTTPPTNNPHNTQEPSTSSKQPIHNQTAMNHTKQAQNTTLNQANNKVNL